jgi:beta-lactamase regulating signal transducer with metallopeptidase domain
MESIQPLTGLGLVASGFLRILAVYILVVALTHLTSRAYVRHALWLLFLVGAGFYWTILAAQLPEPLPFMHAASRPVAAYVPRATSSAPTKVTIPFAWDHRLELASGVFVWAYATGLIIALFRLAQRRRLLREAIARARPVSSELDGTFASESDRLGISRCRILELPGLGSPGTTYTLRPLLVIPEGLDSYLDREQFVDVLYHELIHVRRLDFLWGTLGEVVGCLLYFHPAIWLALRDLGRERELACDEAVMELRRGRQADYAFCLTRLARRRILGGQLDPPSHLALLNSFLSLRVQTLLAGKRRRSLGMQTAAISTALLVLSVFLTGWSSLSLAFELVGPPRVNAPAVAQNRPSTPSQEISARRGKRYGQLPEIKLPPPNQPAPRGTPSESAEIAYPPQNGGHLDALLASPQVESRGSPVEDYQPPAWDTTPPPKPRQQSPVSWRRIIVGAATDALGHVAQGRGGDGEGNDRESRQR